MNNFRQFELSNLPAKPPSRKGSCLKITVSVGSNCFDSYRNNFGLMQNDSSVIEGGLVKNRNTNLAYNFICNTWLKNILDDIPGMIDGIILKEMISTSIAGNFQFGSNSYGASEINALIYWLHNVFVVSLEVQGDVVDASYSYFNVKLF